MAEKGKHCLTLRGISIRFGGIAALQSVDISIARGSFHSLIGPNGAGKSTLLNAISGIYRLNSGIINYEGTNLSSLRPHKLIDIGICRTFQNPELFNGMTVLDNLLAAQHCRFDTGLFSAAMRTKKCRLNEEMSRKNAFAMLEVLDMLQYADSTASNLPFGKQRLLEIGRSLICNPKLFLLDEPVAGLSALEAIELENILRRINQDHGTTILLVEHNMKFVMRNSDVITVLNFGNKIAEGSPEEIQANKLVLEAYLGERIDA
jgi:branched-chain amino acid transport system permease protein